MEAVFSYILGLGAAVMMPILFTILGVCIRIPFSKALKSGLCVGVGFVGLSVITGLLTSSLGPALSKVVEIYGLNLEVFDMGWPAAASVAYNTLVGSFIIPVCLGVNLVLLLLGCTRTINIDLWNYWHFAFIGAVIYFLTDSIMWGFFAAIICYIITLTLADMTAKKFQKFYPGMEGISIPQPFCQGFTPFAIGIGKVLDLIPGFDKLNIDAEGMKKKFGLFGEPLFLGVIIGIIIGCLACKDTQELIDKIVAAKNYLAAYFQVRQLQFGILDMAWHTLTAAPEVDAVSFEKQALAAAAVMPDVPECAISTSFGHIFSGGYSAGYYGYLWAEVLDKDAFSIFEENGVWDLELAKKFKETFLEKGGSEEPMTLYKSFAGREPDSQAFLKGRGLL